ncbi:MAG: DUF547 domain-containing protein [Flavobacterium sp.]|nr:DUF547 domain-containing protein [Flavobacterium sp.]
MSNIIKISEQLLLNIKLNTSFEIEIELLKNIKFEKLLSDLITDNHKKTFWINVYNSFFQILANQENNQYVVDKKIFQLKKIEIAQKLFSLNDIEHGVLRKSKFVFGFGYLKNPFYSKFIKLIQVEKLDYRIHFALNCGATSCPTIRFYEFNSINEQLNIATSSFLSSETQIDFDHKRIKTSRLLFWYFKDFGSLDQIKKIIENVFNHNLSTFSLSFLGYNWTMNLKNFN